jgi:hypothetical protein
MGKLKDILLALVGPLVRPVAKLLAKGAVKLVLMTKIPEDDELLKEMAKAILDAMGSPPAE